MSGAAHNLTADQLAVIVLMEDEYSIPLGYMAKLADMDVKRVRAAVRGLKDMGLADYGTCWDETEGRPCGSGYSLTAEGWEFQRQLSPDRSPADRRDEFAAALLAKVQQVAA